MEFSELYRLHGAMVIRRARAILGNDAAAQDAAHDVFLKAMQAAEEFRREASPVTWLYRITTNHCLNQLRDAKRRRELLEEQGPPRADIESGAEERVELVRLLAGIPDDLREIAIYFYLDRMSREEIATVMNVSLRTVGNRLAEFRAHLGQKSDVGSHDESNAG